jgi:hypothetical protein
MPFDDEAVIKLSIHFSERLRAAYAHSAFIVKIRVDVNKRKQASLVSTRQEHDLCLTERALTIKKQSESWQIRGVHIHSFVE